MTQPNNISNYSLKLTIGTHGTFLSFNFSLTRFDITRMYGNANLTNIE